MSFVIRAQREKGKVTLAFNDDGVDAEVLIPAEQAKRMAQALFEGEDFDWNIDGTIWSFGAKKQRRTDGEKYTDIVLHADVSVTFRDSIEDQWLLRFAREMASRARLEINLVAQTTG